METLKIFIGSDADTILWWQVMIRAIIIFFIALVMVRFGGKRIFGKHTAFDIVLGIVLGSILGRAITGNAPFLTSIIAAFTLVFLHWLIAFFSIKWDLIGRLVKGNFQLLVKDGEIQWDNMKKNNISERDLHEAIRLHGNGAEVEKIETAYYERSGEISIQLKDQ
jgi:uncharacterized membrane protein YcaP (DUF421 family)